MAVLVVVGKSVPLFADAEADGSCAAERGVNMDKKSGAISISGCIWIRKGLEMIHAEEGMMEGGR